MDELRAVAKREIVRIQIQRFHSSYAEYFNREDTRPMVDYFFDRIYSFEEDEQWRHLALSTFAKVKSLVKKDTREGIEALIELNALTDRLDLAMADELIKTGWKPVDQISLDSYDSFFKRTGLFDDRQRQLDLVFRNMKMFYAFAHRPINATLIKPARALTKFLGIYPLFASIEEGYHAVLPVSRELFDSFFSEVELKERQYLERARSDLKSDHAS